MKTATASFLLIVTASSAFASGPSALACLSATDAKDCLAGVAKMALASEKSTESRIEGYASLLTSLAKTAVRRDDVFTAATVDESAPIYSRWSLAVARRTYALRFGISDTAMIDPERIEALAMLLRNRRDGFERLTIAWTACEAREDAPPATMAKWDGVLDRLCRMDASDAEALDKGFPGLATMATPLFNAYNRDDQALRQSLAASVDMLFGYEVVLAKKLSAKEREGIHMVLTFGHLFNAMALATSGHRHQSVKAIEVSLDYLRKAPSISRAPEFQMVTTLLSWIYAKAGMRNEAMKAVSESLVQVDRGRSGSGGDKATAIATAIETLRVLESTH